MRARLRGGLLLLLLTLILRQGAVMGLRLLRFHVPPYKMVGDNVQLVCEYILEKETRETLYSVKWYKDNEEFYRYQPRDRPASHSYPVDGVRVEHKQSDSKQVYLLKLTLKSSGNYRCEVSCESPNFRSLQQEGRMEVMYYNRENPTITGGEQTYEVGDVINLNCTSSPSYPPADLKWYINGNLVTGEVVTKYETLTTRHDFKQSHSGLRFEVEPKHVVEGRLKVRCTATVSPISLQAETQQSLVPGIGEKQLLVRGGAASNPSASVVIALLLTALSTLAASPLLCWT